MSKFNELYEGIIGKGSHGLKENILEEGKKVKDFVKKNGPEGFDNLQFKPSKEISEEEIWDIIEANEIATVENVKVSKWNIIVDFRYRQDLKTTQEFVDYIEDKTKAQLFAAKAVLTMGDKNSEFIKNTFSSNSKFSKVTFYLFSNKDEKQISSAINVQDVIPQEEISVDSKSKTSITFKFSDEKTRDETYEFAKAVEALSMMPVASVGR